MKKVLFVLLLLSVLMFRRKRDEAIIFFNPFDHIVV